MKEPIRIIHVFKSLKQGGIQNFIMNVYRNIDKTKFQFDFLISEDGDFNDEILNLGGRIYSIPSLDEVGQIKYKKVLKKFFNEHKEYKIVHVHYNQISGIILEVAKKCGVPVRIAHSHSIGNSNNIIVKLYKSYLQSKIVNNATNLFACSDLAAKWLYKKNADKAVIISNGIDVEKFKYSDEKNKKIRQELNIDDSSMIIGNVGRFAKLKNHSFLIDIFKEYQNINSNSYLLLVGEGTLQKELEEKIETIGLKDKILFLGTRKDTDYLYSAFDCFITPSLYEGLGITLIEAQASGAITLASKDVIPKETEVTDIIKYISLNEQAKVWAESIKKNEEDRTKYNIELLKTNYNIKNVVKQLEKIYEEVL